MIAVVLSSLLMAVAAGSMSEREEIPSRFTPLTVDDGLSQGLVTDFTQDAQGYMWIGTYGGLNRYDGYTFRVFRASLQDPQSISHNHVTSVRAAPDGTVWIGTKTGLNRWDPVTEKFSLYRHDADNPASLPDNHIRHLAVDMSGTVWIATDSGLARYVPTEDNFRIYRHDPQDKRSISNSFSIWLYGSPSGEMWIGPDVKASGFDVESYPSISDMQSSTPVVQRYNPETDDFDTFAIPGKGKQFIRHMGALPEGRLILASVQEGIYEFDREKGLIIPIGDPALSSISIASNMLCASDGTIYLVTNEGLLQYSTRTGMQYLHTHNPDNELSIFPPDNITRLFEDDSGLIWVGSNGFGLSTLSKTRYKFYPEKCEILSSDRTNSQYVRRIVRDGSNGIWVATADNVLHHYDEDGNSISHHEFDNRVYALCRDPEDNIWIGCQNGDLFRIQPNKDKYEFVLNLGNWINDIAVDPEGGLLAYVEQQGILKIIQSQPGKYSANRFSELIDLSKIAGASIFFDRQGRIWVTSEDSGIIMLESLQGPVWNFRTDENESYSLSNDSVSDILQSDDGTIWIATFGGLNRYRPETHDFERTIRTDGLLEEIIFCLEEDSKGILWLGTANGLVNYNPLTKESTTYTIADGLQSNEFNIGASCRLEDGDLVFGGIHGFNRFNPDYIPMNTYEPPIVVTSVRVSGKERSYSPPEILELPNDDNFITFTFAALDFTNPQENQFAFLLEGYDEEWHNAGTQHSVSYHLSPGDYTLRAKASNNDGLWSEKEIRVKVKILPAFWQTWWFSAGVILVLMASVYVWHQMRNKMIRRRAHQLDRLNRQLENQMAEISSLNIALNTFDYSVSNALRTPIRHIKFFNETLLEELEDLSQDEMRIYLERTSEKADNLVDLIDALLTLSRAKRGNIQREDINFSGLVRKIATEISTDGDLHVNLIIQEDLRCSADLQLLTILCTNLLSNAYLFTKGRAEPKIEIGCKINGEKVYFLADNGMGISEDRLPKVMEPFHAYHTDNTFEGIGLGLATCKLIVERHDGRIWIESREGLGTTVFFTLGPDQ